MELRYCFDGIFEVQPSVHEPSQRITHTVVAPDKPARRHGRGGVKKKQIPRLTALGE